MKIKYLFIIKYLFVSVTLCTLLWAGNEEIVEERVQELDELNKEIIEQLPDVPEDGKIKLKAGVIQKDGEVDFTIIQKEIDAVETKNSTIKFGRYEQKAVEKEEVDINLEKHESINEEDSRSDNSEQNTNLPDRRQGAENED